MDGWIREIIFKKNKNVAKCKIFKTIVIIIIIIIIKGLL